MRQENIQLLSTTPGVQFGQAHRVPCPAQIKHEYDTQGNEMYRIRPSLLELEGGLQETPLGEIEKDNNKYVIESELLSKRTFNDNLPLDLDSKYSED